MRDAQLDMTETPRDLVFECPRCHKEVSERLYGPCPSCAEELRVLVVGVRDDNAVAPEFEPKMNVTPNAVALKDD